MIIWSFYHTFMIKTLMERPSAISEILIHTHYLQLHPCLYPQLYTSFISCMSSSPNLKPARQPMVLFPLAFYILLVTESYSHHLRIIC